MGTVCAAAHEGVDFVGFHLINQATEKQVINFQELATEATKAGVEPVVVTKLRSINELADIVTAIGAKYLQLHADWPIDRIASLTEALAGQYPVSLIGLVGAHRAATNSFVTELLSVCDFLIVDQARGGTGQRVPSAFLDDVFSAAPADRVFLAGGLDRCNVVQLVKTYKPFAVDVQTAVIRDGIHDHEAIQKFVRAAKSGE